MSKNSLILVLQNKQENSTIDMAKIQIKSEKLTPFGGIFSIMEQFDSTLSSVIDSPLSTRKKDVDGLVADLRDFKVYSLLYHPLFWHFGDTHALQRSQ